MSAPGHCRHCSQACCGNSEKGLSHHLTVEQHAHAVCWWHDGCCPMCAEAERITAQQTAQPQGDPLVVLLDDGAVAVRTTQGSRRFPWILVGRTGVDGRNWPWDMIEDRGVRAVLHRGEP